MTCSRQPAYRESPPLDESRSHLDGSAPDFRADKISQETWGDLLDSHRNDQPRGPPPPEPGDQFLNEIKLQPVVAGL